MKRILNGLLSLALIGGFAVGCFAWEDELAGTTEITGFYQQYRDFSMMGDGTYTTKFEPKRLAGGGFSVAQNLADWFAIWLQMSFYGKVNQDIARYDFFGEPDGVTPKSVRIINELQGIRYQTKQYGPFRLYGKGGAGVVWYGFDLMGGSISGTKFSAIYGGGADIWLSKNIGITLDVSHVLYRLPRLNYDKPDLEKFDSGIVYTTGLTFRF